MKSLSAVFWPLCCLALGAAWFIAQQEQRRLSADARTQTLATESYHAAVINARKIEAASMGRTLQWPPMVSIGPNDALHANSARRRRLVAVFDEISCNACEATDSAFANFVSEAAGPGGVVAVVHAAERRYVAAFARTHNVTFPILWDATGAFAKANGLVPPVLLVVDDADRVVLAGVPIPGTPSWSLPFRDRARSYLVEGPAGPPSAVPLRAASARSPTGPRVPGS
jgi:hypothetical protein